MDVQPREATLIDFDVSHDTIDDAGSSTWSHEGPVDDSRTGLLPSIDFNGPCTHDRK